MAARFTDIPYPAADDDAANKKYVDDNIGGGSGSGLPTGGTTGQQLTKVSNDDFDADWQAAGSGGAGGSGGFNGINHQTGTSYSVLAIDDRNKLVTLNNASPVSAILPSVGGAPGGLVDSYDVTAASYDFNLHLGYSGGDGRYAIGQSFTASVSGALTKARFFLKRVTATGSLPTGNARAKLYSHAGTYGTSSIPNVLLATSAVLDVTTVPTGSGAYMDLTFASAFPIIAGTHYVIVLEYWNYPNADPSNYIAPARTSTLGHSGNETDIVSTGGGVTWTSDTSKELIFYVYTDPTTVGPGLDDTWLVYFENIGAGLAVISTVDSTIDGIASVPLRQDTGIMIAFDGTSYYSCRGAGLGTELLGTTVRVNGSDFTTGSTSLVNITGLTYPLAANTLYEIDVLLSGQCSDTNGQQHSLAFSAAGATGHFMSMGVDTTATVVQQSNPMGTVSATALWRVLNTRLPMSMKTMVKVGANPGNITVQIKKNVAASVTVYIGSRMTVTRIP